MSNVSRQHGFTLVEMMVALMMSLVVMAIVSSVFVSSSDAQRRLQGLAELQANARFAINLMQGIVQGAGYDGCMATKTAITNQLYQPASYVNDFTVPLEGYEATSATAWDVAPDGSIVSPLGGSDILTVRGAVGPVVNVQSGMTAVTDAVPISSNNYFGATYPRLLVSNCAGFADVFQKTNTAAGSAAHATNLGATQVNSSTSLSRVYGPPAFAVPVDTTSFFVRASGSGSGNSLYMVQGAGNAEEMVLGVDGMQIQYGVTTTSDASANEYLTADNVADWTKVVSVRIGLLVSTPDPANRTVDSVLHTVLGVTYPAFGDLRLRRVFTTTINLRNRILQ